MTHVSVGDSGAGRGDIPPVQLAAFVAGQIVQHRRGQSHSWALAIPAAERPLPRPGKGQDRGRQSAQIVRLRSSKSRLKRSSNIRSRSPRFNPTSNSSRSVMLFSSARAAAF